MGVKQNIDLLLCLKLISFALCKVEKDNCNIAETVQIWKDLEESSKSLDKTYEVIKRDINKQFCQHIF